MPMSLLNSSALHVTHTHTSCRCSWAEYEAAVLGRLAPWGTHVAAAALALYPSGTVTPEYAYASMASDGRINCKAKNSVEVDSSAV